MTETGDKIEWELKHIGDVVVKNIVVQMDRDTQRDACTHSDIIIQSP